MAAEALAASKAARMIRRMKFPLLDSGATVATAARRAQPQLSTSGLASLQADERFRDFARAGDRRPNGTGGRADAGAAPSSLLLVRISPSVMIVKRPSARDSGPPFIASAAAARQRARHRPGAAGQCRAR